MISQLARRNRVVIRENFFGKELDRRGGTAGSDADAGPRLIERMDEIGRGWGGDWDGDPSVRLEFEFTRARADIHWLRNDLS